MPKRRLILLAASALTLLASLLSVSTAAAAGPPLPIGIPIIEAGIGARTYVDQLALADFNGGGGPGNGYLSMEPYGNDDLNKDNFQFSIDVWGPCRDAVSKNAYTQVDGQAGQGLHVLDYTVDPDDMAAHLHVTGKADEYSGCFSTNRRNVPFDLDITLTAPSQEHIEPAYDPGRWCLNASTAASSCMVTYRTGTTVSAFFNWCSVTSGSGVCQQLAGQSTGYTNAASLDEKIQKEVFVEPCAPGAPTTGTPVCSLGQAK